MGRRVDVWSRANEETEELEEIVAQRGLVCCFINLASKGLLFLHKCVCKHVHTQSASVLLYR